MSVSLVAYIPDQAVIGRLVDVMQGNGQFNDAEAGTSYAQASGLVIDSEPRTISNLIVDQTDNNPAATAAAAANPGSATVMSPGLDGVFGTADDTPVFFIPNIAPDEGLSAGFNSWMTFFGQFFDHGLDLVTKGGSGTVFIPLQPDDPLFDPLSPTNFMVLTRATNQPGPDGILGTADDIRRAKQEGKLAYNFDFQGTNVLQSDLSLVATFYRLGVRRIVLPSLPVTDVDAHVPLAAERRRLEVLGLLPQLLGVLLPPPGGMHEGRVRRVHQAVAKACHWKRQIAKLLIYQ